MKIIIIFILLLLPLIHCQTPPRSSTPIDEISGVKKPPALRYISPKEGSKVFSAPSGDSPLVADLAQNSKIKIIDEKFGSKSKDSKKSWVKIEFERNNQIFTGWVMSDSLSSEEIISKEKESSKSVLQIDKSIGPVVRIRGRFVLAECVYNTGYGSIPYYFLGDQKQVFVFHEDGSYTFDINVCSGTSSEEGNFLQSERTIRADVAGNPVLFEVLNSHTLKIIQGAEYLSCQVCREAYLVRSGD